ncbi:hypothetical protein ACH9L7_20245 (plasmid) [Haloferax sp. S1W]|uniref:hypothetical protein n=1 Tax=Haloferax sp. S1W TaxID=3377110 RepID=UPI0037CB1553
MVLSDDELEWSLRIVKRMISKGVAGKHHKQPQSIAGWFAVHDRGTVKQVLDSMVSDPDVPLRRKGRGTVTLVGIPEGKRYLRENGSEPPTEW